MAGFFEDVRLSLRQLVRQPVFALTAIATLAVGISVNAVAFTIVNGLLFKGQGVRGAAADVGRIATTPGGDESGSASIAEYRAFEEATRGALDLAAEGRLSLAWRHDNTTETAWVLFVSRRYFSMVDAVPLAGRIEIAPGAGGPPAVVIGERFWRRKLNAAPLAGLTLRLNGTDAAVAGVVPESFRGPAGLYAPDVWLPLEAAAAFNTSAALGRRDVRWLFVMGRLAPGVQVADAQGRVEAAAAAMAREWPDTHRGRSARFRLLRDGNSELRLVSAAAAVAMGVIGIVLLLACFNVANLLLARAVERERDMGIRAALGASPARLMRLTVVEGLIVAVLAAGAAVVLASWTQAFAGFFAIPIEEPQFVDLTPDGRVVAFIAALGLLAGTLPGLWPAIVTARVDVLRVLGSQGGSASSARPSKLRKGLVAAQVAGSTAFLAMAGLFVQSYGHLGAVDLGFDRDHLIVAEFDPSSHGYDTAHAAHYADRLMARVRALPGVSEAALADRAPFFVGFDRLTPVASSAAPCEPSACPKVATLAVGPEYFRALGVPLAGGRAFTSGDGRGVAIVNEPLARRHWPDGRAIGEQLRIGDGGTSVTIVGVTSHLQTRGLTREQPTLYLPVDSAAYGDALSLVVRTATPAAALLRTVADAAASVDPAVALSSLKTMEARTAVQLWPFRTISWLLAICGGLTLLLATVGLAGVVVHAANRRVREFGIRVSLGATRGDLVREVLTGSMRLLGPGLAAGLLIAVIAARLAQSAVVGVNVLNPVTYFAVAAVECAVVAAACLGPAWRASRVDPLDALRAQ